MKQQRVRYTYWFIGVIVVSFVLPLVAHAGLVVSEVAWMGTSVSTADEWIELHNTDVTALSLEGWTLEWGTLSAPKLVTLSGSVAGNSYYLLERTDDTTVLGVAANIIYSGSLSNTGETLLLKQNGVEKYRLDATAGWPSGDNTTKETMQLSGSVWVTAPPTPKAPTAGSNPVPPEENEDDPPVTPVPPSSSPVIVDSTGALSVIKVSTGRDRTAVVGAPLSFDAITTDGSNRIIDTHVVWSFGDGASGSGKKPTHAYQFPGSYVVVATAESGVLSAQARFLVKVLALSVVISKATPGPTGFVELENKSTGEVNIGGLRIYADGVVHTLPPNTIILPGGKIQIPNSVTGMYTMQSVALELADGTRIVPDDGTIIPPVQTLIEENKLRENEVVALQAKVATLASALASRKVAIVPQAPAAVSVATHIAAPVATSSPVPEPIIVIAKKRHWWNTLPASILSIFRR